jgi:DNA-binding response OmpR family regulator
MGDRLQSDDARSAASDEPGPNETPEKAAPRLLIMESDADLRRTLVETLEMEGYATDSASSLEQALTRVDEQTYGLVLADLYIGQSLPSFAEMQVLRRRIQPTPVGALTTRPLAAEAARQMGVAFVIEMPFDIETLSSAVAVALHTELSAEQEEQAQVAQRYFAALEALEWATALALCSDEIEYYPPRSFVTAARQVRGKRQLLAYIQATAATYTHVRFTDVRAYASPKGLICPFTMAWISSEDERRQVAGRVYFRFTGTQISQLGVRVNLARFRRAEHQPHAG